MRALIINSMFVNALYRRCADELGSIPGVDLTVLTTDSWVMNGRRMVLDPVRAGAPYRLIAGRAAWRGKENRGFYLEGIARAFRHSRPEVIFLMEEPFSVFAIEILTLRKLLLPNVPVVFFTWNNLSLKEFDYRPAAFYRNAAKLNLRQMDYALTANQEGEAVLREVGFAGPVQTVGYGVDTAHYTSVTPAIGALLRAELGLKDHHKVIGYVGRMLHMKGIDLLINAFAVQSRGDDALRLLLVGSGEDEEAILAYANAKGISDKLVHRASVAHRAVPAVMAAIDVLVLPSRRVNMWAEQFGRVLVEAMAAGTPVIGSTSGAIPEVIGNAGLTFKENDAADLQATIDRLLRLPDAEREALLLRGKIRATEHFSWKRFAEDAHAAMLSVLPAGASFALA